MPVAILQLECRRCQYCWWPRTERKPKACPRCNSLLYQYTFEERPTKRPSRWMVAHDSAA